MSNYILVIDDDEAIRSLLREVLESEGYRVKAAASAAEAHHAVDREPPSLILLDMRMPDDGPRFKKQLRERSDGAPIVAMSATSDGREWASAMGVRFVAKPFDLGELLAAVRG